MPGTSEPAGGRVLVVDDEAGIIDVVTTALRFEGYEVGQATSAAACLGMARASSWDLVILDVMLPDMPGVEVCSQLRSSGIDVPVLFLTALDATEDRIAGLAAGGDDYVAKPFSVEELVLRVKALLRRGRNGTTPAASRLSYADLILDTETYEVWRASVPVELTAKEFRLLEYLLTNARRVRSKDQILDAVWGFGFDGDRNIVETYVSYVRRKIDTLGPPLIHTVRGIGYTLRSNAASEET